MKTISSFIKENMLFDPTDKAARQKFVDDDSAIAQAFMFNFLGIIALYDATSTRAKLNDYIGNDGRLQISNIGDSNNDTSLIIKIMHDQGFFKNVTTVNEITRFLFKLKSRAIKEIDPDIIIKWLDGIKRDKLYTKMPRKLRKVYDKFLVGKNLPELAVDLKILSRTMESGEFRTLGKSVRISQARRDEAAAGVKSGFHTPNDKDDKNDWQADLGAKILSNLDKQPEVVAAPAPVPVEEPKNNIVDKNYVINSIIKNKSVRPIYDEYTKQIENKNDAVIYHQLSKIITDEFKNLFDGPEAFPLDLATFEQDYLLPLTVLTDRGYDIVAYDLLYSNKILPRALDYIKKKPDVMRRILRDSILAEDLKGKFRTAIMKELKNGSSGFMGDADTAIELLSNFDIAILDVSANRGSQLVSDLIANNSGGVYQKPLKERIIFHCAMVVAAKKRKSFDQPYNSDYLGDVKFKIDSTGIYINRGATRPEVLDVMDEFKPVVEKYTNFKYEVPLTSDLIINLIKDKGSIVNAIRFEGSTWPKDWATDAKLIERVKKEVLDNMQVVGTQSEGNSIFAEIGNGESLYSKRSLQFINQGLDEYVAEILMQRKGEIVADINKMGGFENLLSVLGVNNFNGGGYKTEAFKKSKSLLVKIVASSDLSIEKYMAGMVSRRLLVDHTIKDFFINPIHRFFKYDDKVRDWYVKTVTDSFKAIATTAEAGTSTIPVSYATGPYKLFALMRGLKEEYWKTLTDNDKAAIISGLIRAHGVASLNHFWPITFIKYDDAKAADKVYFMSYLENFIEFHAVRAGRLNGDPITLIFESMIKSKFLSAANFKQLSPKVWSLLKRAVEEGTIVGAWFAKAFSTTSFVKRISSDDMEDLSDTKDIRKLIGEKLGSSIAKVAKEWDDPSKIGKRIRGGSIATGQAVARSMSYENKELSEVAFNSFIKIIDEMDIHNVPSIDTYSADAMVEGLNGIDNFGKGVLDKTQYAKIVKKIDAILADRKTALKINASSRREVASVYSSILMELYNLDKKAADSIYFNSKGIAKSEFTQFAAAASLGEILSKQLYGENVAIKPYIPLDINRMKDILKYNNIEVPTVRSGSKAIRTIEDIPKLARDFARDTFTDLKVSQNVLKQQDLDKLTVEYHQFANGNHGARGLRFIRSFDVAIPLQAQLQEEWIANDPTQEIIKPMFHGTGSVGASMILRYGFAVIKSGDSSVTGRMLGDGIYGSNVIDKAAQYVGDAGYSRQVGLRGYLFEINAALGKKGQDYQVAGLGGNDSIRSPEWCVFTPNAQFKIYKAYEVEIVHIEVINKLRQQYPINEAVTKIKSFKSFLREAVTESTDAITYTFRDGMIPISKTEFIDFEEWKSPSDKVRLEFSGMGPQIVIDNNIETAAYVVAYTSEMMRDEDELTKFLDLVYGGQNATDQEL